MKKLIILLLIFAFASSGCSEKVISMAEVYQKFGKLPIDELPEKYNPSLAVENDDYVDVFGEISNDHLMTEFLEKAYAGDESFIRIVRYTIEGDALIYDIYHDGKKFTAWVDYTRDSWGGWNEIIASEYEYLEDIIYLY